MRLIDADAVKAVFEEKSSVAVCGVELCKAIISRIDEAPTVDAVEVIRCKDCKYWLPHSQFGFDEDNDEYYDYCELLVPDDDYYAIPRQADDYCSRAERKEHETD